MERPPAQEELGVLLRDRVGGEGEGEPGEPPDPERQRMDGDPPELPSALHEALQVEAGRARRRSRGRARRTFGRGYHPSRVASVARASAEASRWRPGSRRPAAPAARRRPGRSERLAAELRRALRGAGPALGEAGAGARRCGSPTGGRSRASEAYRDDPAFVPAARRLAREPGAGTTPRSARGCSARCPRRGGPRRSRCSPRRSPTATPARPSRRPRPWPRPGEQRPSTRSGGPPASRLRRREDRGRAGPRPRSRGAPDRRCGGRARRRALAPAQRSRPASGAACRGG